MAHQGKGAHQQCAQRSRDLVRHFLRLGGCNAFLGSHERQRDEICDGHEWFSVFSFVRWILRARSRTKSVLSARQFALREKRYAKRGKGVRSPHYRDFCFSLASIWHPALPEPVASEARLRREPSASPASNHDHREEPRRRRLPHSEALPVGR